MHTEQRLVQWNATFHLVEGDLVCQCCTGRQALGDAEQPFNHSDHCQHLYSEFQRPWVALHEILDSFRG